MWMPPVIAVDSKSVPGPSSFRSKKRKPMTGANEIEYCSAGRTPMSPSRVVTAAKIFSTT